MRNKLIAAAIAVSAAGLLSATAMAAGPRASSHDYIQASPPAASPTSRVDAAMMGPRASGGSHIADGLATQPVSDYSAAVMGPRASSLH